MYVIDLHFFTQQIDYININQLQVHSYFILITLVLYANILKNPLYFFFGGGGPQHLGNINIFTYIQDAYLFSIVSFDLSYIQEIIMIHHTYWKKQRVQCNVLDTFIVLSTCNSFKTIIHLQFSFVVLATYEE